APVTMRGGYVIVFCPSAVMNETELTLSAATLTPPRKAGSYAMKLLMTAPVAPLNTLTCGPPPGPAPVTISGTLSVVSIAAAATKRRVVSQKAPHQVAVDVVNIDQRHAATAGGHRRVGGGRRHQHDVVAVAAAIRNPQRHRAAIGHRPFRQIAKRAVIAKRAD